MDFLKKNLINLIIFTLLISANNVLNAEEEESQLQAVADQIQVLTKDLKTLEKAVYKKSDIISSPVVLSWILALASFSNCRA